MSPEADTSETGPDSGPEKPGVSVYAGLFLVTLSTLLLQLGLTRIFSVIMYYHMAFFAVSITLFGIALGGVTVYFLPRVLRRENAPFWLGCFSLIFSVTTAFALARLLGSKIWADNHGDAIRGLIRLCAYLAVPFTSSGIVVALALSLYPARVHRLYGFDLAGAALGCILFAPMMSWFGGPRFILVVAIVSAVAGCVFFLGGLDRAGGRFALAAAGIAVILMSALAWRGPAMETFKLRYVRGIDYPPERLVYDRWNAISRITAYKEKGHAEGVAKSFYAQGAEERRMMIIDALAATAIVGFNGSDFSRLFYPFHDISYASHAVLESRAGKKPMRVGVIGVGGGRDILAAKAWGREEVVGMEINPLCIDALTREFGDFAGRPLQWPGVTYVIDEARSHLTRTDQKFDLIQASLIDTFAATSAGAFVLSENSLYTLEGWRIFLSKLTDDGMISMTRWHTRGTPVESVRLLALARAALEAEGIRNPQDHLLMTAMTEVGNPEGQPMATLLVKKSAFTPAEVRAFDAWISENRFKLLVAPGMEPVAEVAGVLQTPDLASFTGRYPFRIDPPTDDRPFFFDVLRWRDVLKKDFRQGGDYIVAINFKPLVMLVTTFATLAALCFVFIIVPFLIEGALQKGRSDPLPPVRRAGLVTYFVMLGLGYMMIELSLIQRFAIFLGHPSYSLAVCLASMLLASGAGSMCAGALFPAARAEDGPKALRKLNLVILGLLLLTWIAAQWTWNNMEAQGTPVRMILTAALITPAAFFMGMAFPVAIRIAAFRPRAPLSWYWGINGAFSVCASVMTVMLAHQIGLRGAFMCGAACYLVAASVSRSFGPVEKR